MAATIFGFDANEIKPQPGLQIRRTENGGFEASHELVIKASDFASTSASFAKGQLLSGVDAGVPEPFNAFLKIDSVSLVRSEGDLYTFQVTATGSGTGQFELGELGEAAQPTYDLAGQLVDTAFSNHRKWTALESMDKALLGKMLNGELWYDIANDVLYIVDEDKSYRDQLTADDAKEFAKRIQQGDSTYEKAVYTWTETTEGNNQLIPQQLNKLGLISTPRGSPPEPVGTRDWMLTGASQSQSGQLYRTNLTWTLSDEGGHDSFLYED